MGSRKRILILVRWTIQLVLKTQLTTRPKMKQQKIKQLWMGEMREEKLIESNNSVKGVEGLDIPLMIVQILLYAPDVTRKDMTNSSFSSV